MPPRAKLRYANDSRPEGAVERIILLTGKGGVGKTSLAAAHAWASAAEGKPTLLASMDAAHNLSDLFGTPPAPTPREVAPNLHICEIDAVCVREDDYAHVVDAVASALVGVERGPDDPVLDVPGLDPLFYLLKVDELVRSGRYARVILDLAPTGETLALLQMPELLRWWMERLFPLERVAVRVLAPVSERLWRVRLPDARAMDDIERLYLQLRSITDLLKDADLTSVRLVTQAERMVVEETKRSYLALNLYGYAVDHVFVNGLYPAEVGDGFFGAWIDAQAAHLADLEAAFGHVPSTRIPRFASDIDGPEHVARLAGLLGSDAFGVRPTRRQAWAKTKAGGVLTLPLPHATRDDLTLTRAGHDLALRVGGVQRNIPLPASLLDADVSSARLDAGVLTITFTHEEES